jgi:hypothetical protein
MVMFNFALGAKVALFIIAWSNQWSNLSRSTLRCIFHLVSPAFGMHIPFQQTRKATQAAPAMILLGYLSSERCS